MTDRLMLLDTASLYYRAYYGVPESTVAPDGTPVNAVRGLLDFIRRLVNDHSPTQLVACWDDDWRPEFRVQAIASYKAHRVAVEDPDAEDVPDTLAPQIPVIIDVLESLGIPRIGVAGFEADDVIATLATRSACGVRIVSGDRDLFQLVDDARDVKVVYTARSVSRPDIYDQAAIAAKYAIPGDRYADFSILRGDPSDGLPGVKGIGEKTAASLITDHGSLAAVRAAAADDSVTMAAGVRRKLLEAADYLDLAPNVVSVVRDVPIPPHDARIVPAPTDVARFEQLVTRWGLGGSAVRAAEALSAAAG
ncbi:MAG: 5'-3' exonuclease [Actinobacteria bacterium]|nr:5'-3' exonuclease [Actinomycetota bacterium]